MARRIMGTPLSDLTLYAEFHEFDAELIARDLRGDVYAPDGYGRRRVSWQECPPAERQRWLALARRILRAVS